MRKFIPISVLFTVLAFLSSTVLFGQNYQKEEFRYISPKPGSKFINPENNIAFRHGDEFDTKSINRSLINVTGSVSGTIAGHLKLSTDTKTLIFYPDFDYQYGETINVKFLSGLKTISGLSMETTSFSFQVVEKDNLDLLKQFYSQQEENEFNQPEFNPSSEKVYKSSGDYPNRLPIATITEYDSPAPGYIFCGPRPWQNAPYDPYMMILDNYGTPVFYRQSPRRVNDFKLLVNNQLTYCDFNNNNPVINKYLVLDSWFNIIDTLVMGNGYYVDQHDVLMRENGNHFLMAYDPQIVGMDTVVPGGDPEAIVVGFIIQELDPEHNVIFQWRSWDHFEITDANHKDFTEAYIDYVHGNAFELDNDNTLLMSCRDMEEITKIDLNTGEIKWRFGLHAQNNMFTFLNDTIGFSWQHDIRRLENGNITIYDNGSYHNPQFSQAVEYHIDETNFTAELVWNFIHDPVVYASATGSNRRLPNNNAFICWGLTWPINYSEVTHDKSLAWQLHWPENVWEYRAFKFDWKTDLFELNKDTIDFGTYDDYVPWPSIIILTNNSGEDMEITSTHNFTTSYTVITGLPITIPANGTANLTINFFPTQQGQIDDVLTIRSESMYADTLNQMIACQVFLTGFVEDNTAPTASITPADGTTEVPLDTQVIITFDESVTHFDGSVLKSDDISDIIDFKETDASGPAVEYTAFIDAWKRQIVITPQLKSNQQYYVELKANSVSDKDGNILATAETSTFTTEDVEAPVVVFFPEDSAVDVKRNVVVTITFNEKIFKSGGDEITDADLPEMLVYKETDTLGVDVVYTAVLNEDKTEIQIIADEDLEEFQQYYAAFLGNMVQDEAGNMVEMGKSITFTTGDEFGINDYNWNSAVRVFPNPNKGLMTLEFSSNDPKSIEVFNAKGKVIFDSQSVVGNIFSFDISNQPQGIYFIRVINPGTGVSSELKVIKN